MYNGLLPVPNELLDPPAPLEVSYGIEGSVGDFLGREERPIDLKKLDMLLEK
jgi:hypothetical protein